MDFRLHAHRTVLYPFALSVSSLLLPSVFSALIPISFLFLTLRSSAIPACTTGSPLTPFLQEVDSGDRSEELVCGIKDFHSAVDINHVLGELYKLLAASKISPRRGAVMAYTCNLLLRTLPAINEELEPEGPEIIIDIPRPKRDDDISPERAFVNRTADLGARLKTPVAPDSYDGYTSTPENSK